MGKPAARLTDSTAHGGLIMGPGCPTVLIGKMPAATLGDMHVCPMVTPAVPPIPHVGGPILLGSMGVFIGKKPAARLGDMCLCVGPPSTVIMGCMTVLIGEAGSGSQAGAAGAAAAAQAAKMKGPKALEAFPAEEPGTRGEMHFIQSEFADAAGKPVLGAPYTITDPNKMAAVGASSPEGRLFHDGFAKAGGFKVVVPALTEAKWEGAEIKENEEAGFSIKTSDIEDGAMVFAAVYEKTESGGQRFVDSVLGEIRSGKMSGKWKPRPLSEDSDAEESGGEFQLLVTVNGLSSASGKLKVIAGEKPIFEIVLEGWKAGEEKEKRLVLKNAAGAKIGDIDLEAAKPEGGKLKLKVGRKKPRFAEFYGKSGKKLYELELK